jgi:hypothetical protein
MQKHMADLIDWAKPIWAYFIRQIQFWRGEPGKFEKMLNLPTPAIRIKT